MYPIEIELEQVIGCKSQGVRLFAMNMKEASSPALVLKSCPAIDSLKEVQIDLRKGYRQANLRG